MARSESSRAVVRGPWFVVRSWRRVARRDTNHGPRATPQPGHGRLTRFCALTIAGEVFVVRAGRKFELLATNPMGEILMATPAISGNLLIVRTGTQIVAVRG